MISVIIPVYNRQELASRAVQSVVMQDCEVPLEVIVIDDGSDTPLHFTDISCRNPHTLKVIRTSHKGVSAARNTGIKKSSGTWIALLDSDDYWLQGKVKMQLSYHLHHNTQCMISQCKERWIRKGKRVNPGQNQVMRSGYLFEHSVQLCCISSSSTLIHKSIFDNYGLYDERMKVCEDYDLYLRITTNEYIGLIESELVVKHGGHSDQLSKSQVAMDRFRVYSLIKLLLNHKSLTPLQRHTVLNSLVERSRIISNGARKRKKTDEAQFYEEILYCAKSEYIEKLEMLVKDSRLLVDLPR